MLHDSRTLWSGATVLIMVVFLLLGLYQYSEWLAAHDLVIGILIVMFVLAVVPGRLDKKRIGGNM